MDENCFCNSSFSRVHETRFSTPICTDLCFKLCFPIFQF